MKPLPPITICQNDHAVLERLLAQRRRSSEVAALAAELERAEIVDESEVTSDVVTMGSVVRFVDEETGDQTEITLVYPHDANVAENKISVLAPVGAALLGLRTGQSISWPVPSGRSRQFRLAEVLFQPAVGAAQAY